MRDLHALLICSVVQAITCLSMVILPWDVVYLEGYGDGSGDCVGVADAPSRMEAYENGYIFDITHKFTHTPVGDSTEGLGQFLTLLMGMKDGSDYNFSEMKIPVQCGTYVDAPGHTNDNY